MVHKKYGFTVWYHFQQVTDISFQMTLKLLMTYLTYLLKRNTTIWEKQVNELYNTSNDSYDISNDSYNTINDSYDTSNDSRLVVRRVKELSIVGKLCKDDTSLTLRQWLWRNENGL